MNAYDISGHVTFTVVVDWTDDAIPSADEALRVLQSQADAYEDLRFSDVTVSRTIQESYTPEDSESPEDVHAGLRDSVDVGDSSNITVSGTTTVFMECTMSRSAEPSDWEVKDVLADAAPCSALNVTNVDVEDVSLRERSE